MEAVKYERDVHLPMIRAIVNQADDRAEISVKSEALSVKNEAGDVALSMMLYVWIGWSGSPLDEEELDLLAEALGARLQRAGLMMSKYITHSSGTSSVEIALHGW